MKKNNQRKQAALAAIAMLLMSAIVISTATFAWFTLGRSAQVEEIDLKVTKQGEGIAISANAEKFTDTITFANLKGTATDDAATAQNEADFNAISEDFNHFSERISPASSEFALNKLPVFFAGGIDRVADKMVAKDATSSDGVTINEDAGFYAFDVFVKNAGANAVDVKVNGSKIIVNDEGDTYDDKGDANFYDETVKAMRIGFVNCGTVTTTAAATQGDSALIFADSTSDAKNTAPITAAGEYDVADDAYTTTNGNSYQCPVDTGADGATMTLAADSVTQIRVYIWMEGQDANCTDSLMSQYIKANIVFSLV